MTPVTTMPIARLALIFSVGRGVALWRTEFSHPNYAPRVRRSERGREDGPHDGARSFQWTAAVKVLAAYVLRYAAWGRRGRAGLCPILEGERGTPAATLNYALSKQPGWLCGMFGADDQGSAFLPDILKRINPDLKLGEGVPVKLWLDPGTLPPEQVEIVRMNRQVEDPQEMEDMAEAIESTCRPPGGRPTTILSLRIPGNIQDWTDDRRDQIKRLLQNLGFEDAEIIHVESGSIKLTLRLPSKQAERLFWAANAGELQSLGKVTCKYAPIQDQEPALAVPGEVTAQPSARCSLLVVDDEPMILSMLVRLFSHDYEVLTAASAAAAQRILEQRAVDLILTDQRMPQRTGVQLLEWVRQHHPRTVRLLMTGQAELDDAIEAINRGQVYQYLLKNWRIEELEGVLRNAAEKSQLEQRHNALLAELEQRVHVRTRELEQANKQLRHRARELERLVMVDSLTGLYNSRTITNLGIAELKRHNRYRHPLTIGILDVGDGFPTDQQPVQTEGVGTSAVLRRVGPHPQLDVMREVDSLGRVGGEEFLIIARETNREGAVGLAERVRATVAATPTVIQGKSVSITASLGLAVAEEDTQTDYDTMYKVATSALQEAKKAGYNRFVLHSM